MYILGNFTLKLRTNLILLFLLFFLFTLNLFSEDFGNYTVVKGDSLSKISKEHLSDPRKWRELLLYNKIESPNLIKPGLVIKIPDFLSKTKINKKWNKINNRFKVKNK